MPINSTQIHNELVSELLENLFEVTDGPNSSACLVVESMVVRILILASKEFNVDIRNLTNTFCDGVKNRITSEQMKNII